jgi:hypothetical protein
VFGDEAHVRELQVHCYSAAMRGQVRIVMRYAESRMLTGIRCWPSGT